MKALQVTGVLDVSLVQDSLFQRENILRAAAEITKVDDELELQDALDAATLIRDTIKGVEETRVAIKSPIDKQIARIQALAKEFVGPLEEQLRRLERIATAFEIKRREEARLEEERLKREREEAKRKETEAREAEEKAKAEAERLKKEAEQAAARAAEAELLGEKDSAALAAEAEQVAQKAEESAKAVQAAQTDLFEAKVARVETTAAVMQQAPPAKVAGLSIRKYWAWEVTDAAALYAARPELVTLEAKKRETNKAVDVLKASDPNAQIPGLKIWQETEGSTKASR